MSMSRVPTPPLALLLATTLLMSACTTAPPLIYVSTNTPNAAYSKSVQAGQMVYVSGQLGRTAAGLVPGFEPQARQAMDNLAAAFNSTGVPMDNVVKCQVYLTDLSKLGDFSKIYVSYFKPDRLPARTSVGVAALPSGAEVEVDCIAQLASK